MAGHHKNRLVASSSAYWLDAKDVVAQMLLTNRFMMPPLMNGLFAHTAWYRLGHWDQEVAVFIRNCISSRNTKEADL